MGGSRMQCQAQKKKVFYLSLISVVVWVSSNTALSTKASALLPDSLDCINAGVEERKSAEGGGKWSSGRTKWIIAELQVSGERRGGGIIYILKWLFTCFNILMEGAGFSTGFIADLNWIHHTCFQSRHAHFHFLCLQVLYNLFAL